jgi:hypothetical protein
MDESVTNAKLGEIQQMIQQMPRIYVNKNGKKNELPLGSAYMAGR